MIELRAAKPCYFGALHGLVGKQKVETVSEELDDLIGIITLASFKIHCSSLFLVL